MGDDSNDTNKYYDAPNDTDDNNDAIDSNSNNVDNDNHDSDDNDNDKHCDFNHDDITWAPIQYKDRLSQVWDSHVKDKTVVRPSYL